MYRLTSYIAFSQNNAGVNNVKLLHLVKELISRRRNISLFRYTVMLSENVLLFNTLVRWNSSALMWQHSRKPKDHFTVLCLVTSEAGGDLTLLQNLAAFVNVSKQTKTNIVYVVFGTKWILCVHECRSWNILDFIFYYPGVIATVTWIA